MFQLDTVHPSVIYRRPTGRLMRPSDHMLNGRGLGEVDGVLDVFKNFGSSLVQTATFGIYNPQKNRFYVPFSSGGMRNWMQGITNTATLGLVKTDKFFDSKAMKTVGTIAGVAAAGATAYFGGQYLMKSFGGSTPTSAPTGGTSTPGATYSGSQVIDSALKTPSSTGSLFPSVSSFVPSLDTVSKTLDITSKLAPIAARAAGGGAPLPPPMGGGPGVVIVNQPSGGLPMGPSYIPDQSYGYGYDPMMGYSNLMPPGGGVTYGGGGIGPPGSEYEAMAQQEMMNQQGVMQPVEGMSMGTKVVLIAGVGVIGYLLFVK